MHILRFKSHRIVSSSALRTTVAIVAASAIVLCSCSRTGKTPTGGAHFTDEVRLACTPVKDQGRSSLCWVYAMLATIETEHIMAGDSVNLSVDCIARRILAERARLHFLSRGKTGIDMRGMASAVPRIMAEYGIYPYDSYYARDVNYNSLARRIAAVAATSPDMSRADKAVARTLDDRIGHLPPNVYMLGAQYTPVEFAHSVCARNEYVALTSFTHHPYGTRFALEVPDNRDGDMFLNVTPDELMRCIESSLRAGHPVCWEGDTSEPGFSFSRGTAVLRQERACTAAERQREFECLRTTDDHCMELIGIARDGQGKLYFIAKNSWGTRNPYGGMMYLSENYVRLKTVAVVVKNLRF